MDKQKLQTKNNKWSKKTCEANNYCTNNVFPRTQPSSEGDKVSGIVYKSENKYSSLPNRRGGGKDEPFLISVVPVISVMVGKNHS